MANFCLPKELTQPFLKALKSGELDPGKLSEMSSEARRAAFTKIIGEEYAKPTNALFESKLLLKNQQQGIITWAKSVGGLKPSQLSDLATRLGKLEKALSPAEEQKFLEDFVAQKVGAETTFEQASKINKLVQSVESTRAAKDQGGDRLAYGRAQHDLAAYVGDLKEEAGKVPFLKGGVSKAISEIGGTSKAIKASLDDSFIGRQGWKTIFTNPTIWAKNAGASFLHIWQTVGGKNVMREINADILSRPTYPLMKQAKLAIGNIEEAFPTHLPEKIPILGRLYKASENAYVGMAYQMRADIFDKYIDIAKRTGVELDKEQLESIGKVVNSLTGRGYLGKYEPAANFVNNLFFSPRFLKSQIDFLTAHQLQSGVTPFMRKVAAENMIKAVVGTATLLYIIHSINPKMVETDPTSADFGKIKVGDTRFDMTGGAGSVLTLAMRLALHKTKSSTSGVVSKLDTGKFGSQSSISIVEQFARGKLAPLPSVIVDLQSGSDAVGNKATAGHEAAQLAVPLPITNALELYQNPKSANTLVGVIADALGISTNTYSPPKKHP